MKIGELLEKVSSPSEISDAPLILIRPKGSGNLLDLEVKELLMVDNVLLIEGIGEIGQSG